MSNLMYPAKKKTGFIKLVSVPYAPNFVTGKTDKKTVKPVKKNPTNTLVSKVVKAKGQSLSQALKEKVSNAVTNIGSAGAAAAAAAGIGGGMGPGPSEQKEETTTQSQTTETKNQTPWGMIIAIVIVFAGIVYAIKK